MSSIDPSNKNIQFYEPYYKPLRTTLIVAGFTYSGLRLSRSTYWFCNLLAGDARMRELIGYGLERRQGTFFSNRCVELRSSIIRTVRHPVAATSVISLATFLIIFCNNKR